MFEKCTQKRVGEETETCIYHCTLPCNPHTQYPMCTTLNICTYVVYSVLCGYEYAKCVAYVECIYCALKQSKMKIRINLIHEMIDRDNSNFHGNHQTISICSVWLDYTFWLIQIIPLTKRHMKPHDRMQVQMNDEFAKAKTIPTLECV